MLADPVSKCAILIDPVIDTVERDLKLIEQLKLNLIYISKKYLNFLGLSQEFLKKSQTPGPHRRFCCAAYHPLCKKGGGCLF